MVFVFIITGRLTSVTNIEHIELNNTALLLTFTPPATLVGVPISNYSIEFVDKNTTEWTSGNNPVLSIHPSDYCTEQMMIKVSAWNGVGKGETNNYTYALHEGIMILPITILNINTLIKLLYNHNSECNAVE